MTEAAKVNIKSKQADSYHLRVFSTSKGNTAKVERLNRYKNKSRKQFFKMFFGYSLSDLFK